MLSKDVKTGIETYKKVLTVYKKTTNELYVINVDGKSVTTTSSHLFMMSTGLWKSAKNIQMGDKIVDADGNLRDVKNVQIDELKDYTRIYNLEVEDYHTYFVGDDELWVHNNCFKTPTSELRRIWKEFTGTDSINEIHHGLPEEFKVWFKGRGLDVNNAEYFFDLPEDVHRLKIGDGIHTNNSPLGKNWNTVWAEYIRDNGNATVKQIIDQLNYMSNKCGIDIYKAIKQ